MATSVVGLSIDCADPVALAGFWSEVLARPVNPGADAENAAIDATDPAGGPRLAFHKVPERETVKDRLHLDLRTDQFEAESKRLAGLGATPVRDVERPTVRWTTFADPEGNEFDLVASVPAQGPARGEQGGLPVVILTTTGTRSGSVRKTPIMRVERDGVYAATASYAGNPRNPQWYYNILAHPEGGTPGRRRGPPGAGARAVRGREAALAGRRRRAQSEPRAIPDEFRPRHPGAGARADRGSR